MGQWAAQLAGEALSDLPAGATIRDYAGLAARRLLAARHEAGLDRADRLATSVIILPRRRPLEVWVIGDSHFGYKTAGGEWTACPQGKLYDDITGGMRRIVVQQEIMAIYKTEKVNPLAGCLPIVLQIPIFYALYKTLLISIEMRHQPFVLWLTDLSAPDPLTPLNLFGLIAWQPPAMIALGVLPILLGVTMWLQQKLSPAQMATGR
jgi:hypothetical protein